LQKKVVLKFENTQKRESHAAVSPEYEVEMKEFNEQLQRAISDLSEKNRAVFLMNRIDDMTYNEIAANLDISVKAVEKRMKTALSSLRKLIVTKF
jgi:RNA polymerase sigma-70 factor (ECF subfamily)